MGAIDGKAKGHLRKKKRASGQRVHFPLTGCPAACFRVAKVNDAVLLLESWIISVAFVYETFPLTVFRRFIPLQRPVNIKLCQLNGCRGRQWDEKIVRH